MRSRSNALDKTIAVACSAAASCAVDPTYASADAPMNFLQSFGTKADSILGLTWGLLTISIIVVVLMTGYSDRLKSGETIDAELVLKPFSPQELIAALTRALAADGGQVDDGEVRESPPPARSGIA